MTYNHTDLDPGLDPWKKQPVLMERKARPLVQFINNMIEKLILEEDHLIDKIHTRQAGEELNRFRHLIEEMACCMREYYCSSVTFHSNPDRDPSSIEKDAFYLRGQVASEAGVAVTEETYGLHISCGFRMPSNNYRSNCLWWQPVVWAIEGYLESRPREQKKVVMAYIDSYPPGTSAMRMIDADNQDIGRVTDALAQGFLKDDGPIDCWVFQAGRTDPQLEKPVSDIYMIDQDKFLEWLQMMFPEGTKRQ